MSKAKTTTSTPVVFEPEFVDALKDIFEQRMVFNQVPGLKVASIAPERVVGHFAYKRLHGGVISASLDALGGLAVMAAIGTRHMDEPVAQRPHRFGKLRAEVMRLGCALASVNPTHFFAVKLPAHANRNHHRARRSLAFRHCHCGRGPGGPVPGTGPQTPGPFGGAG